MTITDAQIRRAADTISEIVALELGHQADQLLGRPAFGTDEWLAERRRRNTPEGIARIRDWHLLKLRIARAAGVDQTGNAIGAHKHGASWATIAEACGITRQAAYDRWGKHA